ncbi:MAG: AAA family ATPase [Planctomycetia bacterium]|nr:AAA family ATPase [Planctomycetia bacterium]
MPTCPLILPFAEGASALGSGRHAAPTDGFMAGPENGLLVRVVEDFCAGAECPYNPLVLYGPPGIGKSHVARAIVERFAATDGARVAVSMTGREFASGYAAAVASHTVPEWRDPIRAASLLVIDDIDVLGEKLVAQVEFLHTMDAVIDGGGQVVATMRGRATPSRLLPQVASRLSAGITIGLAFPGPAARLALLRRFVKTRDVRIEDAALRLLAEELVVSTPELSGAVYELQASHSRAGAIDVAAVAGFLKTRPVGGRTTLHDIAVETARHYALSVSVLRSASRRQGVALARGVAVYLARQLTGKSLSSIGRYFGGRDHSTVLHACRKTEELMAHDATLRNSVLQLQAAQRGGESPRRPVESLSKEC